MGSEMCIRDSHRRASRLSASTRRTKRTKTTRTISSERGERLERLARIHHRVAHPRRTQRHRIACRALHLHRLRLVSLRRLAVHDRAQCVTKVFLRRFSRRAGADGDRARCERGGHGDGGDAMRRSRDSLCDGVTRARCRSALGRGRSVRGERTCAGVGANCRGSRRRRAGTCADARKPGLAPASFPSD